MGNESSKQPPPEKEEQRLKYGPSPAQANRQQQSTETPQQQQTRASFPATSTSTDLAVEKPRIPPPSYNSIYPIQVSTHSSPMTQNTAIPESGAQEPLYQNVNKPPPPLPKKMSEMNPIGVTNPYKWSKNEPHYANMSPVVPILSPTSSPMVHEKNPYIWTNTTSQPTRRESMSPGYENVFDFEKELPKVKSAMKARSDVDFVTFNRELTKGKSLADVRKSLVNNKYLSDAQFIVGPENKIFHAHKMFLLSASYLFLNHFQNDGADVMVIDSMDLNIFTEILTYCYTDKIDIKQENVLELLQAANKLQVRQVTNICHQYITNMFSPETIFIILEKSLEMESEIFQKKCMDYINNNEQKCYESKGFYKISLVSLMKILELFKYPQKRNSELIEKFVSYSGIAEEPSTSSTKSTKSVKKPKQTKPELPKPFIPSLLGPPPIIPLMNLNVATGNLINYDDDDTSSIISKDDEQSSKMKLSIIGGRHQWLTEFSRIDFVCKRSFMLHEIGFSENLASTTNEIRLSISVFEQNKRSDVHHRTIKNDKPGMKLNFVKFSRAPLKMYIGQKFFIKLNFNSAALRLNQNAEMMANNQLLEIRPDVDNKKYFNCISFLTVSEMP